MTLYKIKKEGIFEEGLVNAHAQYTLKGREEAKQAEKYFMFKFFLSCHNFLGDRKSTRLNSSH